MNDKPKCLRVYKDNYSVFQAEIIDSEPENSVFKTVFPLVEGIWFECYFTDMSSVEAQDISLKKIEWLLAALANEATRVGVRDVDEQYYMLQFKLHPNQNKYRNKLAERLAAAIEKADGWLNPIVLTVRYKRISFRHRGQR